MQTEKSFVYDFSQDESVRTKKMALKNQKWKVSQIWQQKNGTHGSFNFCIISVSKKSSHECESIFVFFDAVRTLPPILTLQEGWQPDSVQRCL